jgi:beta-galactosidase
MNSSFAFCKIIISLFGLLFATCQISFAQTELRSDILLNDHWKTAADDLNPTAFAGFEKSGYDDQKWNLVDVPHNWDDYGGYRTEKHGNRHGYAWYRRSFNVSPKDQGKRFFLWFEGVGSYATVWINGHEIGKHAGGRTSFTLDVTDEISFGQPNLLAVRADHPAGIQDLPWVCGGCSPEYGFSEGSQPMGIFRPVHLIVTAPVRVEPFGVHIWNNNDISEQSAIIHLETEVKNYNSSLCNISLTNRVVDNRGRTIVEIKDQATLASGRTIVLQKELPIIKNPHLWSLTDPYLYTMVTEVSTDKKVIDRVSTSFGIRWMSWDLNKETNILRFLLNGKPVFINGVAEYEHLLGQSHAFSDEQIHTRVMQIHAAGFNAFRDAHQPHNLRYQEYWDKLGILWWPQMGAHIWFDTPAFRTNFKNLLRDWVKERRNSPSIMLWGLENESVLPQSFAEECVAIIRELDPTASSQRKITTCNGGKGTDWNVPQNWTGTYGGEPSKYAEDIQKQQLVGEYGAWRNLGLHAEGAFDPKGPLSEDRMTQLMEMKIRLAYSVKEKCVGHFFWLLNSHDNPGRTQNGDGYRNIDRIGPVNYKGLFTSWEEPLDVYYMYRSNFAPKDKEPMVYIASHTWPDRWIAPGVKNGIVVYSNCDEVELFNDVRTHSLGKRTRDGIGTHFQWDDVQISYNVLYAEGRVGGKVVAKDYIVLHHLPQAPLIHLLTPDTICVTRPAQGYHYLYRINCGGPEYSDKQGNTWLSDASPSSTANTWNVHSWAESYAGLPANFASQGRTFDPIDGTNDGELFQTFRYGRHKLNYKFHLPDGDYLVELYFIEPWFGTGGGMNCSGWRLFDVAINDSTVIKNLDIWKESGHDKLLKKSVNAHVTGGKLSVSFPKVTSGQAVISAIAIATKSTYPMPMPNGEKLIKNFEARQRANEVWSVCSWMDTGNRQYSDEEYTFSALPQEFYGDNWIRTPNRLKASDDSIPRASFTLSADAEVYLALDTSIDTKPQWLMDWTMSNLTMETDRPGDNRFLLLKKHFFKNSTVRLYENGKAKNNRHGMYTVIIHQPSVLEQAPPLSRPSSTYEAEDANLKDAKIENTLPGFSGKGYVKCSDGAFTMVEWTIAVGVGDTYGLRFKYDNPALKDVAGKLQLISEDGTLMHEGTIYFDPTSNEWDKVNTTTGTSINAGSYKVRLILQDGTGIMIDNLRVQ